MLWDETFVCGLCCAIQLLYQSERTQTECSELYSRPEAGHEQPGNTMCYVPGCYSYSNQAAAAPHGGHGIYMLYDMYFKWCGVRITQSHWIQSLTAVRHVRPPAIVAAGVATSYYSRIPRLGTLQSARLPPDGARYTPAHTCISSCSCLNSFQSMNDGLQPTVLFIKRVYPLMFEM